jgi:hypothetical protein
MSRKIEGTDDPAEWMLYDDFTSTPVVHLVGCYICEDDEFARMGLPLCSRTRRRRCRLARSPRSHPRKCRKCQEAGRGDGHIAAEETE